MKIYTIVSPESVLLQQKLETILAEHGIDKSDISSYDILESPLSEALFDVNSLAFLVDKKAVVIHNPLFLTAVGDKNNEGAPELLMAYLQNPSPDNVLIILALYEKLDARKKVVKLLKSETLYEELGTPTEASRLQFAKAQLDRYQLTCDMSTLKHLLMITNQDLDKLMHALAKIEAYFLNSDEKVLTPAHLDLLIPRKLENNIFLLTEYVATKQIEAAHAVFSDLMAQNEPPIKLLAMLSNHFRYLYLISTRRAQKISERSLANELNIHPYRVQLMSGQLRFFKESELVEMLKRLAQMDVQIKRGEIDGKLALEMVILGM